MVSLYIARLYNSLHCPVVPGCVQDFIRDLVQGFFWVLLEALGIFLGLDFWLHSIIPVT